VLLGNESNDFTMWIAVWTPRLIARSCTGESKRILSAGDPGVQLRQLSPRVTGQMAQLLSEVSGAMDDPDRANAGLAYALLSLWSAYGSADDVEARALHPAVKAAVRLIRADPAGRSLAELAGEVGLSPSRLSRVFHTETGMSLVGFRQKMQLEKFHALYDRDRTKLLPAALAAGFGSYAQFYRVYKQHTGRRPADHATDTPPRDSPPRHDDPSRVSGNAKSFSRRTDPDHDQ
jgi:AraC-like DNA-binding protein